jgi:TM2 domain-containing membrane protein YozV
LQGGKEMDEKKVYLGMKLPFIVNLLLCFFLGYPLGVIERFYRKNILLGIVSIFFGWIFWWVDLISIIVNKDIKWLI